MGFIRIIISYLELVKVVKFIGAPRSSGGAGCTRTAAGRHSDGVRTQKNKKMPFFI